jgi:hypothetical protein
MKMKVNAIARATAVFVETAQLAVETPCVAERDTPADQIVNSKISGITLTNRITVY